MKIRILGYLIVVIVMAISFLQPSEAFAVWKTEQLTSQYAPISSRSIAIDQNNRPHVVLFQNNSLQHLYKDSAGRWQTEVLFEDDDIVSGYETIAIDKVSGTIHVIFHAGDTSGEMYLLNHAWKTSPQDSWHYELVENFINSNEGSYSTFSGPPLMAVESDGSIHISYAARYNTWSTVTHPDVECLAIAWPLIAAARLAGRNYQPCPPDVERIVHDKYSHFYLVKDPGGAEWRTALVAEYTDQGSIVGISNMVVSEQGDAYLGYTYEGELFVIKFGYIGQQRTEARVSNINTETGSRAAIAIDSLNRVHMLYVKKVGGIDKLYYQSPTGPRFIGDVGSSRSDDPVIAIDSSNKIIIMFQDANGVLRNLTSRDGLEFTNENVASASGFHALALDSNSIPHIVYTDGENKIQYAINLALVGNAGRFQPIANPGVKPTVDKSKEQRLQQFTKNAMPINVMMPRAIVRVYDDDLDDILEIGSHFSDDYSCYVDRVCGTSAIQIENFGRAPLNILNIGFITTTQSPLEITENLVNTIPPFSLGITDESCGQVLAPGDRCGITIEFRPVEEGEHDVTLVINSNDPNNPVLRVQIRAWADPNPPVPR